MTKSAFTGPLISFGQRLPLGSGATGITNQDLAPCVFWGGSSLLDPRASYNLTRRGTIAWQGGSPQVPALDVVPSTIAAANIAAAQVPVAATPLTLVSVTGAGITVLASPLVVWSGGSTVPTNALAIDGASGVVAFGIPDLSSGYTTVSLYDPTKNIARALRFTSVGNDSAATATVVGFDIYGFPMTETVTLSNASIATGKKAWKFITSITPAGTLSGSNLSVGTSDLIGFPLRADTFGDIEIWYNNAAITANTGFLAADTTSPATALTGDVRGTYTLQSASDGTKRLQLFITPKLANLGTTTGLVGVTQA